MAIPIPMTSGSFPTPPATPTSRPRVPTARRATGSCGAGPEDDHILVCNPVLGCPVRRITGFR
jgi:hypothetical protein